jgi:hypothetical protein
VHLNDALRYGEPQAGAALLAGDRVVRLLELLKQLGLIGSGDTGSGVADRDMECAIVCVSLDGNFAERNTSERIDDHNLLPTDSHNSLRKCRPRPRSGIWGMGDTEIGAGPSRTRTGPDCIIDTTSTALIFG